MIDITTTTIKPDIEISSMDDSFAQDKVNTAFRTLYNQMASYKKEETDQCFATFKYKGSLRTTYKETVPKPIKEVPLVGLNQYGQQFNVGKINLNGQVIFCPIDSIRNICSDTDLEWHDVDISLTVGADFGDECFRIGGDGPLMECNCLLLPQINDCVCPRELQSACYCYNYQYIYAGYPFCYNDGTMPNDIIGWYTCQGTVVYIDQNNYKSSCLSCTCQVKKIVPYEHYTDASGIDWTVCSDICMYCVWETWQAIPEHGNPLDCYDAGPWGCTQLSYDHCPFVAFCTGLGPLDCAGYKFVKDCYGIWVQTWVYNNQYSPGLLTNKDEPYIYHKDQNGCCWIRPILWCLPYEATVAAAYADMTCGGCCYTPWYCLDTHHKEWKCQCQCGHWNPNNTYFHRCTVNTQAKEATGMMGTYHPECNSWSSSCIRNFAKACFPDKWNDGIQAIPYNKEDYKFLHDLWINQCDYSIAYGGTYLDSWFYLAKWCDCTHYGTQSGYAYPVWEPPQECAPYYVACDSSRLGFTPLYMKYSTFAGLPHTGASFDRMQGDFKECVCCHQGSGIFPSYGDYCNIEGTPMMNIWCRFSWCDPSGCYVVSDWCATICCAACTWAADMSLDVNNCPMVSWDSQSWTPCYICYPMANDWFNKYSCWIYTPYSYCRLTKVYCVCQHCYGTGVINVGDVVINVKYRKA